MNFQIFDILLSSLFETSFCVEHFPISASFCFCLCIYSLGRNKIIKQTTQSKEKNYWIYLTVCESVNGAESDKRRGDVYLCIRRRKKNSGNDCLSFSLTHDLFVDREKEVFWVRSGDSHIKKYITSSSLSL